MCDEISKRGDKPISESHRRFYPRTIKKADKRYDARRVKWKPEKAARAREKLDKVVSWADSLDPVDISPFCEEGDLYQKLGERLWGLSCELIVRHVTHEPAENRDLVTDQLTAIMMPNLDLDERKQEVASRINGEEPEERKQRVQPKVKQPLPEKDPHAALLQSNKEVPKGKVPNSWAEIRQKLSFENVLETRKPYKKIPKAQAGNVLQMAAHLLTARDEQKIVTRVADNLRCDRQPPDQQVSHYVKKISLSR